MAQYRQNYHSRNKIRCHVRRDSKNIPWACCWRPPNSKATLRHLQFSGNTDGYWNLTILYQELGRAVSSITYLVYVSSNEVGLPGSDMCLAKGLGLRPETLSYAQFSSYSGEVAGVRVAKDIAKIQEVEYSCYFWDYHYWVQTTKCWKSPMI